MARKRAPERVGAPQSPAHAAALLRALKPLIAQVRATLPRVRTAGDARALGAALRRAWPDKRVRELVARVGVPAEAAASKAWAPIMRAANAIRDSRMPNARRPKPYDGERLVDAWSREAASKISSVRDEVAEGLRRDVVRALERGTDPAELAAGWIRDGIPVEFGTLEGRMRVIAQHQMSVLHASVQAERARAVGVTHYVWRTQQDDRVRDEHRELEGVKRSYAESPRPGEPIACRCYAESVISDELAESLGFGIGVSPGLEGGRRGG